ncbi:MAG: hypothetical protein Q4F97_02355 [Bacteroidales bacterium]|nr:hypothetical protein [Bacteroidales bacterium]
MKKTKKLAIIIIIYLLATPFVFIFCREVVFTNCISIRDYEIENNISSDFNNFENMNDSTDNGKMIIVQDDSISIKKSL